MDPIRAGGRPFSAGFATVAFVLGFGCSREPAPAPAEPIENVILLSIDTLRPDRVGVYGGDRGLTPTLDALAAGGVTFEQAIAQAPWTAPSHATMLASQYPSTLGMGDFADPGRIRDAVDTLAEVMQWSGRRTHAIVAGGFVAGHIGFKQGFEAYMHTGTTMPKVVSEATKWLETLGKDEKFFLFLHTYDVHEYNPPEPFRSRFVRAYDGPLARLPPTDIDNLVQGGERHLREKNVSEADRRYLTDLYDASVAAVDAQVELLMGELDRLGRRGRTLIVITSDHGEEFWEHGGTGHGYSLYDENLRVPLILSHPSLPRVRVPDQVRLLDVAPTIAAIAGARPSSQWQGISLEPLFGGVTMRLPAFAEHAHVPARAVRVPEYKYVVRLHSPNQSLYDLRTDPAETADLIAGEGNPPSLERMREELKLWMLACARDVGLRSTESAGLDEAAMAELRELGYTAGAAPDDGRELVERWLEAMGESDAPPKTAPPSGG
jgi:arylsulfatase A-like enzyme